MIFLWFSYDIPNIGPDVFWGESCHSYPVTEDSNDFPIFLSHFQVHFFGPRADARQHHGARLPVILSMARFTNWA